MKRKTYFIAASVMQIILSIYSLFHLDDIVKSMTAQYETLPSGLADRMASMSQNSGATYYIFLIVLVIVLNLYVIYLACKGNLLKKKGSVIACSAFSFFASFSSLSQLIAIINIIVICSIKRVNKEDFPEEKKKMPVLKKETVNKEKIIYAIILLAVYFSQFLWKTRIPDNMTSKMMASILFYALMIYLSITFFKDLLKKNFKTFKENFKAYYQNLIKYIGLFYLFYIFVALISAVLSNGGVSVNQENVEALPIWLSLPLAVIYAPIVEESLFRGCIRRFIKSDKAFIAVSAIAFGLLHTAFTEATLYNVIVVALPYMAMGGFIAYLYAKTNNICTSMAFHAAHNLLAIILSIMITGI